LPQNTSETAKSLNQISYYTKQKMFEKILPNNQTDTLPNIMHGYQVIKMEGKEENISIFHYR
jgi:hypothetical protein